MHEVESPESLLVVSCDEGREPVPNGMIPVAMFVTYCEQKARISPVALIDGLRGCGRRKASTVRSNKSVAATPYIR